MEYENTLKNYINSEGRLKSYSGKRKFMIPMLFFFYDKFEQGVVYSESQVNETLMKAILFDDYAMVRRDLVDFGFMERTRDGREYRKAASPPAFDGEYKVTPKA